VTVHALTVETTPVDKLHQLLLLANSDYPLVWLRKGQGIVGIGTTMRLEFSGPTRMQDAAQAWQDIADTAHVEDPLGKPGTGLVAFGAFSFSASSAEKSVLIIPETIFGRQNGTAWVTKIRFTENSTRPIPAVKPVSFGGEYRLFLLPGAMSPEAFRGAVSEAVNRIHHGDLHKVVLARDLIGQAPVNADVRRALSALALRYPDCWTYSVDGLIGSSPETLVRVSNSSVTARILAGTISRGADADTDHDQAVALATSHKEKDEHEFAVQSVVGALRPHSSCLAISEVPFTLKLPNLWHLATDFEGRLSDGSTSLDLIAALHPTAAVAGTPTQDALHMIDTLEPFDRGRYAGPVGWVGADGDGEWAVALRCAQITESGSITAYAGAGVVAESDPEREFFETRMKFRPIVEAFG
jgi:menaquinone-specific isochorismate synthase